jgi:thiol-disulfide isomerase/thioredoxin
MVMVMVVVVMMMMMTMMMMTMATWCPFCLKQPALQPKAHFRAQ